MNCRDYQHQISLSLYEELLEDDRLVLEAHLPECAECRHALEEAKGFHSVLSEDAIEWDYPSDLLVESRRELGNELDRIEKKRSWWRIPTFSVVLSPMRLLESAALIAMGLALGVYVTNQQQSARQVASTNQESPAISAIPANGSVSNIRIVSANPTTGQVELAGEVVQPLRFQGQMADDTVKQLLFSAMRDSSNPGSRLRAIEVLATGSNDQSVKDALIQTLMYDDNSGVRLKAIHGLKRFVSEPDVLSAFLYTLKNDSDAGIRFEAIEALTSNTKDTTLAKALEPFTKDDNSYISMKALQFVRSNQ